MLIWTSKQISDDRRAEIIPKHKQMKNIINFYLNRISAQMGNRSNKIPSRSPPLTISRMLEWEEFDESRNNKIHDKT